MYGTPFEGAVVLCYFHSYERIFASGWRLLKYHPHHVSSFI